MDVGEGSAAWYARHGDALTRLDDAVTLVAAAVTDAVQDALVSGEFTGDTRARMTTAADRLEEAAYFVQGLPPNPSGDVNDQLQLAAAAYRDTAAGLHAAVAAQVTSDQRSPELTEALGAFGRAGAAMTAAHAGRTNGAEQA